MAVAVFDADVLIAYLGSEDANHEQAVEKMRLALEPGRVASSPRSITPRC